MSILRKATGASKSVRIASMLVLIGGGALLQGCSSTNRDGSDGGNSWRLGSDSNPKSEEGESRTASKDTWQQPTSFDNDGPPAGPRYRGGRDPATGRANTDWGPASPPPSATQSASLAPVPGGPPAAAAPYRSQPIASAPSARAVPTMGPVGMVAAPSGAVEVKQGDTLYRIAKAHNVTVSALMQANGLPNETIKLGQKLMIPAR